MKLFKERSRREPCRNFFSQRVVIPWNALPEKVTTMPFKTYDKCGGLNKLSCPPDRPHIVCEATQVNSGKTQVKCAPNRIFISLDVCIACIMWISIFGYILCIIISHTSWKLANDQLVLSPGTGILHTVHSHLRA